MRSRLLRLALALALGLAAAAEDAPPAPAFERVAALDRPLAALLQAPLAGEPAERLDAQLRHAFALCREHVGFSASSAPGAADDRLAYCDRVKFVRHQRLRFQAVRAALRPGGDGDRRRDAEPVPVIAAAGVSFEHFFQQFAQPQRPVMLQGGGGAGLAPDALDRFLAACFDTDASARPAGAPLRSQEDACAQLLATEDFRVPLFLAHNYLVRSDAALAALHLPTLHRVTADKAALAACPLGLHSFLLPLSSPAIEVALYAREFEPLGGQFAEWREVAVDADVRWVGGPSRGGPEDPETVLDDSYVESLPPAAKTVSLPPDALLFAPGSVFAALSAPSEARVLRFCLCDASNWHAVKRETAVAALAEAADASERGSGAGAGGGGGAGGATLLLRALQAPTFDTSIPRRPVESDARWSEYLSWPRAQRFVRKSDLVSSGALSDEQIHLQLSRRERLKQWQEDRRWDAHIAAATLPVARAPAVVNASRSTVTLRWQELLEPPRAGGGAQHGYQVRWVALAADADNTAAPAPTEGERAAPMAVNVTLEQLRRSARRSALFGDDFDGRDLEFAVRGLDPETAYVFTVRLALGDALGGESPASRAVRTGPCAPPSRPRGVPVVAAAPADTPTCATLRWIDPRDDGGRRIEHYLVAVTAFAFEDGRVPSANRSPTTACLLAAGSIGGGPSAVSGRERVVAVSADRVDDGRVLGASGTVPWRSTRVCALLPGAAYRLRVAASNALGVGDWSQASACVAILLPTAAPPPLAPPASRSLRSSLRSTGVHEPAALLIPEETRDGVPTLRGRGDPLYELASHLTRGHDVASRKDERLPLVVLSDVEQALVVANGSDADELELWAGHFSPRRFRVSAQLVRADPLDASTPLRNAAEVRDRVALVTRGGGVPLAVKTHFAQRAGALGVVIADVDDTCAGRFDQRCVPGADRARREGFAALDRHALWTANRIPCALALRDEGQRLLELLA